LNKNCVLIQIEKNVYYSSKIYEQIFDFPFQYYYDSFILNKNSKCNNVYSLGKKIIFCFEDFFIVLSFGYSGMLYEGEYSDSKIKLIFSESIII